MYEHNYGDAFAKAEGDAMVLVNTRLYKGETKNDPELAGSMASLAEKASCLGHSPKTKV